LPRESLLQAMWHTHLTSTSHLSCTHLTRGTQVESKTQVCGCHFSPLTHHFKLATKRKEIERVTIFLRTSPLRADCESIIAGCTQKIMVIPKLFCEPLRVVCGVKTPHMRLAIWPIFARRQHVEARTAGCKTGLMVTVAR
jgi:hypothetical protein